MTGQFFEQSASKRVTFILATRNRSSYLRGALELARTLVKPQDELIVIDGASTDRTAEVVSACRDLVDVFVSEPDLSPAHAVNKGILLARGRYFQQIPDDDVIFPEAFEQAIALLDDHPEIDLLQCGGSRLRDGVETPVFVPPGAGYGGRPSDVFTHDVCGVGIIIRRTMISRVGLYDPLATAADADLIARAISAGANVRFARINLFRHPVLPHSQTVGPHLEDFEADVRRIIRTHGSRREIVRHELGRLVRVLPPARLARRLFQERLRARSKSAPLVWDAGLS